MTGSGRPIRIFYLQAGGQFNAAVQLVTILIIFVVIIVLAYFVTKWVAGYQKMKGAGTNIEVLESYRVAPNKFIAIVRVGEKYLALAVGKDEMSRLCELSKDELVIRAPGEQKSTNFGALLSKIGAAQGEKSLEGKSREGESSGEEKIG